MSRKAFVTRWAGIFIAFTLAWTFIILGILDGVGVI